MRVLVIFLFASLFAASCSKKEDAQPAAPAEPLRKPGLWSIEVSALEAGVPAPPTGSQVCLDKASDKLLGLGGAAAGPGAACTQTASRKGEGWSIKRVCKVGEHTLTTEGELIGDLEQEYSVDIVTRTHPPISGEPAEAQATITARWLSDCGEDQKPGDVTLSNGLTYNIRKGPPPLGQ